MHFLYVLHTTSILQRMSKITDQITARTEGKDSLRTSIHKRRLEETQIHEAMTEHDAAEAEIAALSKTIESLDVSDHQEDDNCMTLFDEVLDHVKNAFSNPAFTEKKRAKALRLLNEIAEGNNLTAIKNALLDLITLVVVEKASSTTDTAACLSFVLSKTKDNIYERNKISTFRENDLFTEVFVSKTAVHLDDNVMALSYDIDYEGGKLTVNPAYNEQVKVLTALCKESGYGHVHVYEPPTSAKSLAKPSRVPSNQIITFATCPIKEGMFTLIPIETSTTRK
jgi:hypothetical protein